MAEIMHPMFTSNQKDRVLSSMTRTKAIQSSLDGILALFISFSSNNSHKNNVY